MKGSQDGFYGSQHDYRQKNMLSASKLAVFFSDFHLIFPFF